MGAASGGAPFGSSPVVAARPAFFFFLDCFERDCPLACSAASSACGSRIAASARTARAACAVCAVCIVCGATVATGCGGAACCRVGSAVAVRPLALEYRAERAAEGDRSDRAEHHREHLHPGPDERHHRAQGDAEAEGEACVLPDECCDSRVAFSLGPLQGGAATFVEQLGVGLGSQQGLHACLLPCSRSHHQGGVAVAGLQVRVGRVLQQQE
eukprot:scaffold5965_cov69-Phaeocystis_antarctica.AAC.3